MSNNKTYQTHLGFGGAFSDSACFVFSTLPKSLQEEVIRSYFSSSGLRYNLGRLTIGSCDFSTSMYDYANKKDLSDFSIDHDEKYIFPFVRKANKVNKLSLVASSWSPPSFMKDNKQKDYGGTLLKEFYGDYAEYISKYVIATKKAGINLEYLTIQNEPQAKQVWESCLFSPTQEKEFALTLSYCLKKHDLKDMKLLIWDHNKDIIVNRVRSTLNDEEIINAVYGIAYHWYDDYQSQELSKLHSEFKDKVLMFTEGCVELLTLNMDNPSSSIGRFENGLRYAKNYILDSLNYSSAFIDWNLLLNSNGGPNHVGNFCEAPIMYDEINQKLIYNPSFYIIKQFSHFIRENAKRIDISNSTDLIVTSYQNPDGKIIVVVLNEGNDKTIRVGFANNVYSCYFIRNSVNTIVFEGDLKQ